MAYEYRRLTAEERKLVEQKRRELGYPLHAPPHPFRQEKYYLITAANYEHAPVMASPDRRTDLERRLLRGLQEINAEVTGWVVLTNHYHALIGVSSLDAVSAMVKQLHGKTSREWNSVDGQTGKRRVWYKFADRAIRDEAHFYRALNYIHINPVKHGCVSDVYAWPWSSIHDYFETNGRDWLREKWKLHPRVISARVGTTRSNDFNRYTFR